MEPPATNRTHDTRKTAFGRPSATQMDELLSVSQFAAIARITPQAVRKMIARGRLQAGRVGQQHVIVRDELARYLAKRR